MTMSNEDILAAFDLNDDVLSDVLTDEVGFINKNRTVVRKNIPSQFIGTLAGKEFPSELIFREGRLTSLTLIKRTRVEDGRVIYTSRGSMANVKFDISIKMGDEKIDLVDKMVDITNSTIAKSGKTYTRSEFLANIANKNMRFAPINDDPEGIEAYRGMTLFFEHQGTSEEQFEIAAGLFSSLGAIQSRSSDRVVSQYKHPEGVPVVGFEMNRQNRSLNRAGTGFVDLVDSTMSSLLNYFKFAGLLRATDQQIAAGKNVEDATARREMILTEMNNFTRLLGNWGGVQPGVTVQPDGSVQNNGRWYVTNIPCGRVQVESPHGPVELDFWTSHNVTANASVIDTTSTAIETEPF